MDKFIFIFFLVSFNRWAHTSITHIYTHIYRYSYVQFNPLVDIYFVELYFFKEKLININFYLHKNLINKSVLLSHKKLSEKKGYF